MKRKWIVRATDSRGAERELEVTGTNFRSEEEVAAFLKRQGYESVSTPRDDDGNKPASQPQPKQK